MLGKTQTVSQITRTISGLIEYNLDLKNVAVEGQISNYKKSSLGHVYFNLKDENAVIRCAMFRQDALRNKVQLSEGLSIVVAGNLKVYKLGGYYQIVVNSISESKESYMYKKYLELKEKLEKAGYFLPERKRKIPKNIRKIGLITSETSAAIKDFLSILESRNPFIEIYLIDVRVQGQTAADEITRAIHTFQSYSDIDLIVITRGGGSKDELFVFNEESICTAAFNSRIPILSAVGHEIDESLLDLTADISCATPTAAAQVISNALFIDLNTLPYKISNLKSGLGYRISKEKSRLNTIMNTIENRLRLKLRDGLNSLKNSELNLNRTVNQRINQDKLKLEHSIKLLESYNVNNVLKRGFAIVKKNGETLVNAETLSKGDKIQIDMQRVFLTVVVDDIKEK